MANVEQSKKSQMPENTPADDLVVTTFRDVDSTATDGFLTCMHCLEYIRDLPQFQSVREQGFKLLGLDQPPLHVLELGSGLGYEIAHFAKTLHEHGARSPESQVVGIDKSERFVAESRQRWSSLAGSIAGMNYSFAAADLTNLVSPEGTAIHPALPVGTFDRVWEERVFQHIPQAQFSDVLRQVRALLADGGRFVAVEPVWSEFVIESDDMKTSETYTRFWEQNFNHPQIAKSLVEALPGQGFGKVSSTEIPIVFTELEQADRVFQVRSSIERLVQAEKISPETARTWLQEQEARTASGTFHCQLIMSITSAEKSGE